MEQLGAKVSVYVVAGWQRGRLQAGTYELLGGVMLCLLGLRWTLGDSARSNLNMGEFLLTHKLSGAHLRRIHARGTHEHMLSFDAPCPPARCAPQSVLCSVTTGSWW